LKKIKKRRKEEHGDISSYWLILGDKRDNGI
jgi:hypothetical protein